MYQPPRGYRGRGRGNSNAGSFQRERDTFSAQASSTTRCQIRQPNNGARRKSSLGQHHTASAVLQDQRQIRSAQKDHGDKERQPRGMTLGRLNEWARAEEPGKLALFMSNEINQIENFLMRDSIKEDWYSVFVSAVDNAATTQLQRAAVSRILELLCKTPFLEKHLTAFVVDKMAQDEWRDGLSFFNAMTRILETILKIVPSHAVKVITAIPHLKQLSEFFQLEDMTAKVSDLGILASQVYRAAKEKPRCRFGLSATGESPPDDYAQASVLPTCDDIKENKKTFVRPIVVDGGYKDKIHYLDVQFRLMRQDFIIPLQQGITEFRKNGLKKHFNSSDLRLYYDVHILGFVRREGIDHVLQFDISKLKSVRWDFSKRLIFGSLVCLSKDGFETMAIATISNRDPKDLKKGFVNVNFRSNLDIVFNSTPDDVFVMAETVAYYESYCHVLEGLQEMSEHLPLEEYIVLCEKQVKPPRYLLNQLECPSYNLCPLMEDKTHVSVPVLTTTKWPPLDKLSLNESQREAVKMALTKKLAVIQGPPGTGKTYVGLKVVHTLLENQDAREESPILVVCYTNHALDQFLEGILQFSAEGIIRVGGRSKTESLAEYNLSVIKKKMRSSKSFADKSVAKSRRACYEKLDQLIEELEKTSKQMEATAFAICSENKLSSHIDEDHMESLCRGDESGFTSRGSAIGRWLNTRVEDPSESVTKIIESAMTNLVLKSNVTPVSWKVTEQMPVRERAALYLSLVMNLEANLDVEIQRLIPFKSFPDVFDRLQRCLHLLHICREEILTDDDLRLVLETKKFEKMIQALGRRKEQFCDCNNVVKAWLLGLHKDQHVQLDDIEQLLQNEPISETENLYDNESDDITQKNVPDFDADDELDKKYLKETHALRNSTAALIQRISALKLDQQDDKSSKDGDHWQLVGKPLSFAKIRRKINSTKPMTDEQESGVSNVWRLSMKERFALYKLWVERYKLKLADDLSSLLQLYKSVLAEKEEINNQDIVSILKDAKVIGMTTTGAAKYRSVLQAVGCRIIVVEEAAEVLEAHIVTALNKDCEHLILIGDHQQLRPNPVVYELAKDFGLEISLFERLVKNQFPHVVLQEQHRMRPEISKIMRHIYPDLQDHPVVALYDHIKGVTKNVFFVQHKERETSVEDTHSKANTFEALYVIKLCEYFLRQGYDPSQVTILTTYAGQVLAIKTQMKTLSYTSPVRVTAVDNFQGEENDIIILSLVRSNEEKNVGFLKVENRVCVALSRAKKGLFVIGNFELLASQSKLWHKIQCTVKSEGMIGEGLPVVCQNHSDKEPAIMFSGKDFDNRPEGGCGLPCNHILLCGHMCEMKCHGYDLLHENYSCKKKCTKKCDLGHPCQRKCFQDCGNCKEPVLKTIPSCGHKDLVPCHLPAEVAVCCQPCEKILDECEHQCTGLCGHCKKNGKHSLCKKIVQYKWPCGHSMKVKCHQKPENHPCPHPCKALLECGHECKGTCGDCLQGQIHVACREMCRKKLPCGHSCSGYCSAPCIPCPEPCPSKCRHRPCGKSGKDLSGLCGHICIPCKEECLRGCSCQKCSNLCSETCSNQPCLKPCKKILQKCSHRCSGICGEICVCGTCSKIISLEKKLGKLGIVMEQTADVPLPTSKDPNDNTGYEMAVSEMPSRSTTDKTSADTESTSLVTTKGTETKRKNKSSNHDKKLLLGIPTCDHVFWVDELDLYVKNYDPDGSSYIPCPSCQKPIQRCNRYELVNQARAKKRNRLKKLLIEEHECLITHKNALSKSQKVLENSELTAALRKIDVYSVKTDGDMLALSFKFKLAFVLSEIRSFAPSVEDDSELNVLIVTRKDAMLKIGCHVTAQQRREFVNDLTRCLRHAVVLKVKDVLPQNSQNIPVSLTDLLREFKATVIGTPDKFVESTTLEMSDFFSTCIQHLLPSDINAVMQLKLIEKHTESALKVLQSDMRQFLSDIIPPSKRFTSKEGSSRLERKTEPLSAKSRRLPLPVLHHVTRRKSDDKRELGRSRARSVNRPARSANGKDLLKPEF